MAKSDERLHALLAPTVTALGYILWGVEHLKSGKYATLRVYIDHENGISLADCEKVSHQISAILDVEDPISSAYQLEVSSPGMDRPLFFPEQYAYYIGEQLALQSVMPVEGRRKFQGELVACTEQGITLKVENEVEVAIPFVNIARARLVPNFD